MKDTTPTYRIEMPGLMAMSWDGKRFGRPTEKNVAEFMATFNAALLPGGVNAHLGMQPIREATVIRQATRTAVITWKVS